MSSADKMPISGQQGSKDSPPRSPPVTAAGNHTPATPSGLRTSYVPSTSPDDRRRSFPNREQNNSDGLEVEQDGVHPTIPDHASATSAESETHVPEVTESSTRPNLRTRLLGQSKNDRGYGSSSGNQGFSGFRPFLQSYDSIASFVSRTSEDGSGGHRAGGNTSRTGSVSQDNLSNHKMNMTQWLAQKHGVTNKLSMYVLV